MKHGAGRLVCAALVALLLPIGARAQFAGRAVATAQFQSDTNVFDLPSGSPQRVVGDDPRRSDTFYEYGAQFDTTYKWRRQEFHAAASATQSKYQRFTRLNHTSYSLDAGMNWKLAGPWDGTLDVSRNRSMVPFYNLSGAPLTLSLVTDQREKAQVGLQLNSLWKLEGGAYTSTTDQPVFGAASLQLKQTAGSTSIDYLGINGITSGLSAEYLSGRYNGSQGNSPGALNPSFNQIMAAFFARYKRTRTTLDAQLGYSRRTSDNASDTTSGVTGLLDFTDKLTPRTSFSLTVARRINNYVLNSGSEIDTDLGGGVQWQATYKSAFSVAYTFSYRDFPEQGNNPVGGKRVDIQEYVTLDINYQPRRWIQIRPYINATTRRSTFVGGHFSSNVYGVSVAVATSEKRK